MDQPSQAERTLRPGTRSFALLVVWFLFLGAVASSAAYYLMRLPIPDFLIVADAMLLAALWMLARPIKVKAVVLPRCTRCEQFVYPTRHPEGGRLWTCFECGLEVPRTRTYRELFPPPLTSPAPQA